MNSTTHTVSVLTSNWRNAPPIAVVDCARDLPVAAPADAAGLFMSGRVWIVHHAQAQPHQVLAHEALAHHGVRELLGPDWRMTMRDLLQGIKGGRDQALTRASWSVRDAYVDGAGEFMLTGIAEADEVLARLAEIWANPRTATVAQPSRAARVRSYWADFRRRWLFQDVSLTAEQAQVLLADASALVRDGCAAWHPLAWWYAGSMAQSTKPMGPNKPARSLRESEELLAAEKQREENWTFLKLGAILLVGVCGIGLLLHEAWIHILAPLFR